MLFNIYRVLWWIALPFILLYRLYRDASSPFGIRRFNERCAISKNLTAHDIVIHAVSLGEVRAVTPLIEALLDQCPHTKILFTATTLTGSEQILRSFKNRVTHVFLPLDADFFIRRFLKKVNPKLILVMETEIWPNLIYEADKKQIPLYIISACLSQKSFKNYQKIPKSIAALLSKTIIMAQTEEDAIRFRALGAENVSVMGNLKYAVSLAKDHEKNSNDLIRAKNSHLLWVLASSHEGEEQLIIDTYLRLKNQEKQPIKLILAIAPRHPERFKTVEKLLVNTGLTVLKRSELNFNEFHNKADVWLFDNIGDLLFLYGACDIATVGGSFVPIGGHNILEPAFLGKPIVIGPFIENISDSYHALKEKDAIVMSQQESLFDDMSALCNDEALRLKLGRNARQYVEYNQGALSKLLSVIKQYI